MRSSSAFCPTCGEPTGHEAADGEPGQAAVKMEPAPPQLGKPRHLAFGIAIVLGVGLLISFVLARSAPPATLLITTTPAVEFKLRVASAPDGETAEFDGALPLPLRAGDYFLDVVPNDRAYQRKRLKVHLTSGQQLALPVVLAPSSVRP